MVRITPQSAFEKIRPESVIFVTSVNLKNECQGRIVTWHMKCSLDPPMYAVAIWKTGHTHNLIKKSKEFIVSFANEELIKEVEFFGSTSGEKVDKFKEMNLETEKSDYLKSRLIKKASISLECIVHREVDAGDCTVFIGKVLAAHHNKDKLLFNMPKKDGKRVYKEL